MSTTANARCAVVTGGTGGIGAAIAKGLASAGLRVIVVGRSAAAGQALAQRLNTSSAGEVSFEQADLSSQREVRQLVDRLSTSTLAVDVLVNNAAGVFEQRRTSEDGIEYTLALNHLSPLLMTLQLEPLLRRSAHARVIQLAADPGMLARQPPDPDDLQMKRGYSGVKAYMRSKNLNVISAYRLARQFDGSRISVNACHPGIVRSGLAANLGAGKRLAAWLAGPLLLSPAQGADTPLWLATSEEAASVSGRFFVKRREVRSAPCTHDASLADRVWKESISLIAHQNVAA